MCGRNSRVGSKTIVALFVLFSVLASPCFAASPWLAWFSTEKVMPGEGDVVEAEPEREPTEAVVDEPQIPTWGDPVPEPSPCISASEESKTDSLTISRETLSDLEQEFTSYLKEVSGYVTEVDSLKVLLQSLQDQLSALRQTDAISEEEYRSVKASLVRALDDNDAQAARILELEQSEGDLKAHIKKEAGPKAFALGGAFLDFDGTIPSWGLSGTLGLRIGEDTMASVGADYEMGSLINFWTPELSLDRLRVRAQIGWMW